MRTFTFAAVVAACSLAGIAQAKTVVFPHALEVSGRITNTQFTFDTTIFAQSMLEFDETDDMDPDNNYYVKKHIGNVKYEEISFATGQKLSLTLDITDITETFVNNEYRTTFAVLFGGTFSDNGVDTQFSSIDLSVFGFEPQPLSGASAAARYVATLPAFDLYIAGTSTVFAQVDEGAQFTLVPAPGTAGVLGAVGLVAMRRRR